MKLVVDASVAVAATATPLGFERLRAAPIAPDGPSTLPDASWALADEMGWAKTYDANYAALARLRSCRLVTLDARLRRGAHRLGFVVGPTELEIG